MLSRCVSITIAVCLLAALPIIFFHGADDSTSSLLEVPSTEQEVVVESDAEPIPEVSRLDRMSWILYGVYAGACLLLISLFVHYARAYKDALLKAKWMSYTKPEASMY